jgi:hypothetical protein
LRYFGNCFYCLGWYAFIFFYLFFGVPCPIFFD